MADFDPSTAYRDRWRFMRFVESVTWERMTDGDTPRVTGLKAKFGDVDTPESQSLAAGISFTNEAAAVVVWQPTPTGGTPQPEGAVAPNLFAPTIEVDVLRREERGMEGWLIKAVKRTRLGEWLCVCQREVTNG